MTIDNFSSRIRLRHIQCFVAVAQEQHLGKAAGKLMLSQPAVSKTLLELEGLVGARLVDRGRFGARLTRDGQTFLTHAVSVLDALDGARHALNADSQTLHDLINVGTLPTVAPDLLPPALAEFHRARSGVRVDIQEAANALLLDKLQAGEVDFALGRMADPQMMAGVSFELLYMDPLVIAARTGHALTGRSSVSLNEVIQYLLVVSTKGTVPRHNTESYLQARGLRLPAGCFETLSVSIARLVALHSDALWFTPMGAVREDVGMGLLQVLPVSLDGTEEPVGLLHRRDSSLGPSARTLMAILRETAVLRRTSARVWRLAD